MIKENKQLCVDVVNKLRGIPTSIDELVEALPKVLIEPWNYHGLTFLVRRKHGINVQIGWVARDDEKKHYLCNYKVWGL